MAAAALGIAVVTVLAVGHRDIIRDQLEAWRFQRGRKMSSISPGDRTFSLKQLAELMQLLDKEGAQDVHLSPTELFSLLAHGSGRRVIFDPLRVPDGSIHRVSTRDLERPGVTGTLRILKDQGYRVVEQYLPGRAYVVVFKRDPLMDAEPQFAFEGVVEEPATEGEE